MRIGFLGLGEMGTPMARNLITAGCKLRVWDRSPAAALALGEAGAYVAETPGDAFATEVAFTMLRTTRHCVRCFSTAVL